MDELKKIDTSANWINDKVKDALAEQLASTASSFNANISEQEREELIKKFQDLLNKYPSSKELSPEERITLERLEKEHDNKRVQNRINTFKKAPAHIRQSIIDMYEIQVLTTAIDNADSDTKPSEELELLRKRSKLSRAARFGFEFEEKATYDTYTANVGLSIEQLRSAHAEALIEESIQSETTTP